MSTKKLGSEIIKKNKLIPQKFYARDTVEVAKDLLGAYLVHDSGEGRTIGKIIETEAYLCNDPACHAARGKTKRNEVMFGPPGIAYIYFIYGMYYCFNVVTAAPNIGEAVLIRALEPIEGIELMKRRRKKSLLKDLCSGPGKLVQAMGITRDLNGINLQASPLRLYFSDEKNIQIVTTTRIGIRAGAELPLRFYIKDNPYVSKPVRK